MRAPGIAAVAQILQAIGDVSIVAPAENQSGKGHSIVTSEPVYREDLTLPNGMQAIGLTATPASTVNIAIRNILKPEAGPRGVRASTAATTWRIPHICPGRPAPRAKARSTACRPSPRR